MGYGALGSDSEPRRYFFIHDRQLLNTVELPIWFYDGNRDEKVDLRIAGDFHLYYPMIRFAPNEQFILFPKAKYGIIEDVRDPSGTFTIDFALYDIRSHLTYHVETDIDYEEGEHLSWSPSFSADGRFLVFTRVSRQNEFPSLYIADMSRL